MNNKSNWNGTIFTTIDVLIPEVGFFVTGLHNVYESRFIIFAKFRVELSKDGITKFYGTLDQITPLTRIDIYTGLSISDNLENFQFNVLEVWVLLNRTFIYNHCKWQLRDWIITEYDMITYLDYKRMESISIEF